MWEARGVPASLFPFLWLFKPGPREFHIPGINTQILMGLVWVCEGRTPATSAGEQLGPSDPGLQGKGSSKCCSSLVLAFHFPFCFWRGFHHILVLVRFILLSHSWFVFPSSPSWLCS